MAIVAQGQISIVDLHDMPPVQAHLEANKSKTIIKMRDNSISPNITTSDALLISAELYESGSQTNLFSKASGIGANGTITGITWTVRQGSTIILPANYGTNGISISAPSGYYANSQMKITKAATLDPNLTVSAVIEYRYIGMDEATPITIDIDFSTVYHGSDGDDAYSLSMSNTAHIFPINPKDGTLIPGVSTTCDFELYQGNVKQDGFTITKGNHSNLFNVNLGSFDTTNKKQTVTISVNEAVAAKIRATGAPETEQGVIPFTITAKDGKTKLKHDFSWAVSSKGVNGNDSTSYWMIPSTTRLVYKPDAKTGNFAFDKNYITLQGKKQTGKNPVQDAGSAVKFSAVLYDAADTKIGNTITGTRIPASGNLNTNTRKIVIEMRTNDGDNILLDTETIQVQVIEKDPVTVSLTSNTREVRNSSGTATLTFSVFRKGKDVSTTCGDITWRVGETTSTNKTNTLTIAGSSINNFVNVKASVVIQGTTYYDTISIIDVSDPIQVMIMSSLGDQFVNGFTSTELTAVIWQNGVKIDEDGSKYIYTWKKFNRNGDRDNSFGTNGVKTGKTITVTGTEVSRKAIFVCELSTKS